MRRPSPPPIARLLAGLLGALPLAGPLPSQQRVTLDGEWELARDAGGKPAAYEQRIQVPSAFETVLGTAFDGVAWYRRLLPLAAAQRGARIRVEFAAVATHATVFCNGREVGQHLGAWTPFRVELTDALQWHGKDVLEVRVDERVGHNTQGFLPVVEPHFGGIWQGVTLCVDQGPVFDRLDQFAFGHGDGRLDLRVGTLAHGDAVGALQLFVNRGRTGQAQCTLHIDVLDGGMAVVDKELPLAAGAAAELALQVPGTRLWSPRQPNLYGLRLVLLGPDRREFERLERRIGFRELKADGSKVLWNGAPLQVRGILHWGYSPPHLAPPPDPEFWRRQLEDFRSLGFNTLKCCLWVPPACVYELCDELGLLVWQEYPTWHPQMDQPHKADLLREYGEFFRHDGSHPSVAFRSLTCETGHGADLDVVQALFDACHAAVPDTLVVDDSSWIGWQRVTDFWDEHPYGNDRWWPGKLAEFQRFIADKGQKPLLLGECIAADTWVDRAAWLRAHGDAPVFWRPTCLPDQERFEQWIEREFGAATLQSLLPVSRDYAMRTRRYQIETLRRTIPAAGYVVSVARDIPRARMGLYDDLDRLKWPAAEWSWHGDAMLCLETPDDRRAFVVGAGAVVRPALRLCRGTPPPGEGQVSPPIPLPALPAVAKPTRHRLHGDAGGVRADWDVWLLPPFDDARPAGVRVADHLDAGLLDFLEQGGAVYLHVVDRKHSLRSEGKWYLSGAPFAPPHPVHARLPAALLIELQPFDLDGGRVMPWDNLIDQVDPILAFWETHDLDQVRAHLFAFDCRVGQGRLLASCLDDATDAGRYVEHELLQHLAGGPLPRRALSPATVQALRALLAERQIDLPMWRFRTDPKDEGLAAGWQAPATDVKASPWRDLRAGSHWENQAEDLRQYTGVAWYRVDVDVPADWAGHDARAVFEGVDDSCIVWLDGAEVGRFGDPATNTSVWLERQVAELGRRLAPGRHALVLRVVDHGGAGGLWKPVFLTTGPADARSKLLQ